MIIFSTVKMVLSPPNPSPSYRQALMDSAQTLGYYAMLQCFLLLAMLLWYCYAPLTSYYAQNLKPLNPVIYKCVVLPCSQAPPMQLSVAYCRVAWE